MEGGVAMQSESEEEGVCVDLSIWSYYIEYEKNRTNGQLYVWEINKAFCYISITMFRWNFLKKFIIDDKFHNFMQ